MKQLIILFVLAFFVFFCQNQENTANTQTSENQTSTDAASPAVSTPKKEIPFFTIRSSSNDDTENPKSEIYLSISGNEIDIQEAVVACEQIKKADYSNYKIPAEAIDACGGWWAGTGEYFYIIENKESDYYMVMYAAVDEQATGEPYVYNSVMNIAHKFK